MKKAKKNALLLISAALIMGLSACSNPESGTSGASSGDAPDSSEAGDSSNPGIDDTYQIRISNPSGVTIASDKTRAKQGDTVNLTITVSAGFTLTSLTMNGTALTVSNNAASFQMPDRDATIAGTSAIDAENGDVTVGGSVAAQMQLENGVYVAHDVEFTDDGTIYVAVHGSSSFTPFGWDHFSKDKSFGVIEFSNTDMEDYEFGAGTPDLTTNGGESLLEVGGNAKYDIYFDPADQDYPVYIQRTEVIDVPTTADMLQAVFCDTGSSTASYHPSGVTKVTYEDSRLDEEYVWELYEDGSLATVTNEDAGTTTNVYASYDEASALLTVVDTYIEGKTHTSPYPFSSGADDEFYDDARTEDTYAYSAQYKVQERAVDYEDEEKAIKRSQADAAFAVSSYSHDVNQLDRQFHRGYRTGYQTEDDLIEAISGVSSVENADGTFTVTIASHKIYDPTSGGSTYATMSKPVYLEYAGELTFTKAGAPLSGEYREWMHDSTSFDFTSKSKISGTTGQLIKFISYAYEYGTAKAGAPSFDEAPYFATSVSAVVKGESGDNKVYGGWRSDLDDEPLEITIAPSTALNAAQFDVTASSNTDVIAYSHSYGCYMSSGSSGKSTLTIANLVTGTPSVNVEVEVVSTPFRSLYIEDDGGGFHFNNANSINMYSNETYTLRLRNNGESTNGSTLGDFSGMTVSSSNEAACTATVDAGTRNVTFKSGKVEAATTVTLTFNSEHYEEGWNPSTISVTVYPQEAPNYTDNSFFGTYGIMEDAGNTRLTLSNETADYSGESYYVGTLSVDEDFSNAEGGSSTSEETSSWGVVKATITFYWDYDETTYAFKVARVSTAWTEGSRGWTSTYVSLDIPSEEYGDDLGLCVFGEKSTWSGQGETTTDYECLFGQITIDEYDESSSAYASGYTSMERIDA